MIITGLAAEKRPTAQKTLYQQLSILKKVVNTLNHFVFTTLWSKHQVGTATKSTDVNRELTNCNKILIEDKSWVAL